jgi:hypothetical protein
VFVVEINDNPNIETGCEDALLKDNLYRLVLDDFLRRIERQPKTNGIDKDRINGADKDRAIVPLPTLVPSRPVLTLVRKTH